MKKALSVLLLFCMLAACCAFAEQNTVICLHCTVNGQVIVEFEGNAVFTAIAESGEGQAVSQWRLNGVPVEGAHEFYLTFTANGSTVVEAVLASAGQNADTPTAGAAAEPTAAPEAEKPKPEVKVKAIGASIQYLDAYGVGKGGSYTELDFTNDWKNAVTGKTEAGGVGACKITADRPSSSAIDYWVIDGVRYYFGNTVKSLNITNLTQSMTVECVYKGKKSTTLGVASYMKQPAEGERLIVQCGNAKMRHVKNTSTNNAAVFTEFDFTEPYVNEASGKKVSGGSIDFKITANLANAKSGTKVKSWEIDGAKIIFSTDVSYMVVQGLNTSKTYVAHYDGESDWHPYVPKEGDGSGSSGEKKEETKPKGNLCTVDCRGCTFSGGGFSGAGKGDVPVHTRITITYADGKTLYKNGAKVEGSLIRSASGRTGKTRTFRSYSTEITKWTIFELK